MPILKLFQKTEGEAALSNLSSSPAFYWHQSLMKTAQGEELWVNILDEYRCKKFQQHTNKMNSTAHWKYHTPWSSGIYLGDARMAQHLQISKCPQGQLLAFSQLRQDQERCQQQSHCESTHWVKEDAAECIQRWTAPKEEYLATLLPVGVSQSCLPYTIGQKHS